MSEIKPVACRMRRLDEEVFIDNEHDAVLLAEQGWTAENVYIIPDTHRIVSVKLLKTLVGVSYYKDEFMNACEEAQAIIDKVQS
jgi:hypothetical protein